MGGKSSTQTSTVTIPPEVMAQYQQVIGRANQITQKPFQAYSQDPSAFVAPLTSTQQAGIANINAAQGMAQPSVEQGQGMIMQGLGAAAPLQYGSLDTAAAGQGIGGALYGQSLGTAAQGRGAGSQLFGESLGTAAQGTGAAGDIYGSVLPAIQQAAQTGARYGTAAEPLLSSAQAASAPLMGQGAGLTMAGLGAGAQYAGQAGDYLRGGTQAISPTGFSGEQIDKYMSPYMKNVVEAQQALQAEEAAAQRSALKGQAIASGAFGGDRGGIAQANLARQQSLANQATLANLLQGGYGQALGAFQQQQGVDLAAQQANRAAQQFGSQQAAALGQQLFGQNLAAGSQLSNIGQALFGQNVTQGQALAGLGQMLYGQGLGAAQAAAGVGTNIAQMKAQEAALQQQAAQGVFGQAAQEAALQQQAAQGVFGQAAQTAALQQAASNNLFNMANQGGMNYANLGIAGQGAALQGAQAQLGAGQIQQQTEQAAKSAMYNQFLQEQGFPYQQVGFLGNVSMGIGSQSGGTTTTTGGSYSDRRLKEDIRKVGETFDGQPIYSFRYKGEPKTQLGLIAQEVEKMHPDAVGEREGYLTVDYHDATEDAAKRGHFASGGLVPSSMGGAVMPTPYGREGYEMGGDTGVYDPGPPQNTTPAVNIDPRVNALYQKYLFRSADPEGASQWQQALANGMSIEDVEKGIAGSKEKQLVNPTSLTYDASKFGAPAAPVQNRYGFYSAPMSETGSSFTPQALVARRDAARGMPSMMPTASGKGTTSGSTYAPPPQPAATGKMPSANAAPAFGAPRYGTYSPMGSPAASGKGPSTNAYTGTNNMGYSGAPMPQATPAATGKGPSTPQAPQSYAQSGIQAQAPTQSYSQSQPQQYQSQSQAQTQMPTAQPTATGKGPQPAGMANGGRIGYSGGGGASELKDYIDTMSGSPKGLAMSHAGIFGMPGVRADITKYSEGMLKGRSNVPQPSTQQRPQQNMLKEAADFGTSVEKIASLGERAKTKLTELTATKTPTGGGGASGQTPAAAGAGTTPPSQQRADVGTEQFGPNMPQVDPALAQTNALAFNINDARGPDSALPILDDAGGGGDFFGSLGSMFSARGGRINKFDGGPTWGTKHQQGDPSEGAYAPIGPKIEMGEIEVPKSSNAPKPGRGGGGGGGGGGGFLQAAGQVAGIASTAFSVGKALVSFLPMLFSDERLKKHIKPIGRLYDGQTVYRFDMGGETKIGLIAQDVEKHEPEAVGLAGKYKTVDYEMATAKAAKRGHFFGGGVAANDITADPVKQAIQMAALPPNTIKLPDMTTPRDVQSDVAPVEETPVTKTGLNPTQATGLSPTPEPDDRHSDTFKNMLGIESGNRQFTATGAPLIGKAGEGGISQIKPEAAQEAAKALGVEYDQQRLLNDEDYNMKLGKAYFNMQLDRFGGDPMIAAAAYNAGPTRVQLALNTAEKKGGDFLDYLPAKTVNYLAKLSDAAQGAHQGLVERKQKVAEASARGAGPTVVDAKPPGLSPSTAVAQAQTPGLGAAIGPKSDWDMSGGASLIDMVPKSADFWVPLIAAVGGMLGARAPNAANAIGAGLMAGASAYMKREEFQQEAMKNSLTMIKDRFVPNYESEQFPWFDKMMNRPLTADQYTSIISQYPGMPRIGTTMAGQPSGGLGAADTTRPGKSTAPAGGLSPSAPVVEPPKVEAPLTAPAGAGAEPQPKEQAPTPVKTEEKKPPQTIIAENVGKIEIPDFGSQAEADAWVQKNMDSVFKGTPPLLDPRTYLKRAEVERAKEDKLEAEIQKLTKIEATRGGGDPNLRSLVENTRKQYNDAQAQRIGAEDKAKALITGATAIAIERSKERVKVQTGLEKTKGERDIATSTTLRETEPVPGGPKVFQTEQQILDQVAKDGSIPGKNPGAGNPVTSGPSPVVASQPGFVAKRMEAITENEMKMGQQFKERQATKQRFDNLVKIVEAYQTGAFAEFKQDAVRWARGLGFDINDTDTANPEAFQKFRKNAINEIIGQAKGLAGPIAFKELDLIGKGNVDAPMEPGAVASLLADGKGLLNYEDQYYKDYASWRKENPNDPYPDFNFNVGWVEKNPTQRYITEARKDIAALGERLPKNPADYKHGQKYIIRQGDSFGPAYYDAQRKGFSLDKPGPLGE